MFAPESEEQGDRKNCLVRSLLNCSLHQKLKGRWAGHLMSSGGGGEGFGGKTRKEQPRGEIEAPMREKYKNGF